MANTAIRIRVGCALDASVEQTFGSIEKRAQKAAQAVQKTMNGRGGAGANSGAVFSRTAAGGGKAQTEGDKELKDWRSKMKARNREHAMFEKEMSMNSAREARKRAQEEQRSEEAKDRAAERMRKRSLARQKREEVSQSRELDRFATRTSHRFTRFLAPNMPVLSMAKRVAGDVMRGVGVDTSVSGGVSRAVGLQSQAVSLSNQAYNPGMGGDNAVRKSPAALASFARDFGDRHKMDPSVAMGALGGCTTKTGDLQTGMLSLDRLADLAVATGTNLEDMAEAAGNVSNSLGDIPDKGNQVYAVMKNIAAQGKIGAVEMTDLASQMAKITAAAGKFSGSRSSNISKLGALAQIAMGGATSASQATNSVARLGDTFNTPARMRQFEAAGVQTHGADQMLLDPMEIIKNALRATGGNMVGMKKMFASTIAAKPVDVLTNEFNQAGGGEKGMAAVDAMISKFSEKAFMSEGVIKESVREFNDSTAAKAQAFQNQLDRIVEASANKLIPALEKLAPEVLKVADALSSMASWAASNPMAAAGVAISAALLRAIAESAARAGIERGITGIGGAIAANGGVVGSLGALRGVAAGGGLAGGAMLLGAGALAAGGVALAADQGYKLYNELGSDSLFDFTDSKTQARGDRAQQMHDVNRAAILAQHRKSTAAGASGQYVDAKGKVQSSEFNADAVGRAAGEASANGLAGKTLNVRVVNPEALGTPRGREPN